MEGMMEVMAAQIVPAIGVLMATLISIGMAYAIKWLKLKTGSEAVAAAGEVVAATVGEVVATTVESLKAKSEDGKLTGSEARMVKAKTLNKIKEQLPSAVAKATCMVVGDLNTFLEGKIEQEVSKQKVKRAG
jgi:hypothetical protein